MGYSLESVGQGGCQAEPVMLAVGSPQRPRGAWSASCPLLLLQAHPYVSRHLRDVCPGALWALCVPVIAGRGFGVDTGVGLGDEDTSGTVSQ